MPLRILSSADFSGLLIAPACTTSNASIRLPHGTAPSAPADGDMWTTNGGLHVRINSANFNLTSALSSQTANTFFAAPNGSSGTPSFRAIVAADVPTLNQNTTGSAATLTTARTINGTSFNGSANITTANWGTARTITIGSTGKSVDGSANVSWTTAEIGAEFQAPAGVPRNNLGTPTVREMALFDSEYDNKTDRFDINNIWVETSTDNITWTDTSATATTKRRLVGGDQTDSNLVIPYGTNYFRIRLRATSYVYLNALYMYWSSQGHNTQVQIFKKHDSGSWVAHTNSTVTVNSWPGHLFLPFATEIPWHPSGTLNTHYHEVYVLFIPTWNATYSSNNIALYRMQWWGGYPAGRRNLYTTTEFGAALFPNTVSATTLTSTVTTGTAPLTITSTTEVANLNAALLNGYASATTNTNNAIVRRDGSGNFSAGRITATNYADATGAYNVNLGSGGSEGRGLVAGYSGGSYSGIGYNVRHTTTGATYIAPGTDTSSYLLFNSSGFTFFGDTAGSAGRTIAYKTLATLNFSGEFAPAGTIIAPAAVTTSASIRLPHGTAPTSPTNGDMWTTTAGLYVRINGATVGPLGSGGGGGGTVTSITAGTGLTGGTITTSGTIAIDQTAQIVSTRANSTNTGGGQIYLNGATGNRIEFGTNGVAAPAFTTRSVGTKVLLYPAISASNVDYALGIDSQRFWLSVPGNVSSDVFSFYGGTTEVLRLTGDGRLRTLAGTALLPAISPGLSGSDLDTGIFFPAADTIAFSEGGVEVMRIDSSARVGIGTSSATARLQVKGTGATSGTTALRVENSSGTGSLEIMDDGQLRVGAGTASLPSISAGLNSSDTNTGIYFPATDAIALATNGTRRLRADATGVGFQVDPAHWIHLSTDPGSSKYLNIDSTQSSNSPLDYTPSGGNTVNKVIGITQDSNVLGTPDYWMEIKLDGVIVLVPCYIPYVP